MASFGPFNELLGIGTVKEERQYISELVVRFVVYRNIPYDKRLDVHEYLDTGIVSVADNADFDWAHEVEVFERTYEEILNTFGKNAFRKNSRFSLAYFELISVGVSEYIKRHGDDVDRAFLQQKFSSIEGDALIQKHTGAGIRGTQRLSNIIFPYAFSLFQP
jgi:hypothetical protein